jgi:hypothetical protein
MNVCRKPFAHLRENFDRIQKSSKFLLDIMTLVSPGNITDIDEVFSVGGRSLYRLGKAKALKLTPGELCALLYPV